MSQTNYDRAHTAYQHALAFRSQGMPIEEQEAVIREVIDDAADAMRESAAREVELRAAPCRVKAREEPSASVAWNHAADVLDQAARKIRIKPLPKGG